MTKKRYLSAILIIAVVVLLASANIFAAEEKANPAVETGTEIFKWINFAILAAVMLWVFGKLLPPLFRGKAQTISSAITSATSAKAAADAQLRDAEARMANLDKEITEIRASAQKEGATEVDRLRAATATDKEKIAAAAKAEIEAAERAARVELKALAANMAVDRAESLLAKQLTGKAQETLISDFVKSLEGRPN